ncbi:MAG: hypothetical protein M0027_12740 [Candidatus Dormibacteraeota bacterium]|jgi:hypothetical protein|nr:hypothetical protein [Candidatus Dormibacteraeota bacterium]
MSFAIRLAKATVTLLLFVAFGGALYLGSQYLTHPAATSNSVVVSHPSPLPVISGNSLIAEEDQTDAQWVEQDFSGYSKMSMPVQTADGWTFAVTGKAQIFSPPLGVMCGGPGAGGSTYTRTLYGHLMKVVVKGNQRVPTFTIVTAPTGKHLLACP